jgi:glycerol-3-phosphate dehydrogenase
VPFLVGITRDEFERQRRAQFLNDVASREQISHLHQQYGRDGLTVLRRIQEDPAAGEPLVPGHPYCRAEVQHVLLHESAARLSDVMCRRTEASWMVKHTQQPLLAERVARVMSTHLGWDRRRRDAELRTYLDQVRAQVSFTL